MKTATISQAKNRFSALLDEVRQGETILILDRTRAVARLEPPLDSEEDAEGRLARLERAGLVRRGSGRPVKRILEVLPPRPLRGGDVLQALVSERRTGR